MKSAVTTDKAPTPKWAYDQGVVSDGILYVSGQGPADPASGQMQLGSIEDETRQTLTNLLAIVQAAGGTVQDVVRVNVYLSDLNDFQAMNAVYAEFFGESKPARTTVGVQLLAGMKIEVDCIAHLPK